MANETEAAPDLSSLADVLGDIFSDLEGGGIPKELLPKYSDMTELSDRQIRAMIYVLSFCAIPSVIGNTLIVNSIWGRSLYDTIYGRLMLGVSVTNFVTTVTLMLSILAVPADLLGEYGARGNVQTCTAAGFWLTFSIASNLIYLVSLMTHFVLTIRYKYREEYIKQNIEPFFHGAAVLIGLAPSITGLFLEYFNPVGTVPCLCFIEVGPQGCEANPLLKCDRGEGASRFMWGFIIGPGLIFYCYLNVCLILIYRCVLQRASESERFSRRLALRFSTFKHYKSVERQSSLYAINFFLSIGFIFTLPLAVQITDPMKRQQEFYYLQLVISILWPQQGFFTWIIFTLPRYSQIAGRNENASRLWVLRHAVFSKKPSDRIKSPISQSTTSLMTIITRRSNTEQNCPQSKNEHDNSLSIDNLPKEDEEAVAAAIAEIESYPASKRARTRDDNDNKEETMPSPSSLLEKVTPGQKHATSTVNYG